MLLAAAMILAALTYLLLEKPIRFGKGGRKGKIAALCAGMLLLAALGGEIWHYKGVENRWVVREYERGNRELDGKAYDRIKEVRDPMAWLMKSDHPAVFKARYGWRDTFPKDDPNLALLSDVKGKHTTVLLGDSHAMAAYPAVSDYNARIGVNTIYMGHTWNFYAEDGPSYIPGLRDFYFDIIRNDLSIHKVFILNFFTKRNREFKITRGSMFSQDEIDALRRPGLKIYLVADNIMLPGEKMKNDHILEELRFALGIRHPLYMSFMGRMEGVDNFLHVPRAKATNGYQIYLNALRSTKGATVIEGAVDAFCTEKECPFFDENGFPLYYDRDHITPYTGGKRLVEKVLKPYLNE
ncbi:MAG: hypothetical protein LBG69_08190 [Zoogloeaceae bacterium]|nr:hypothetical protein [Zoogloeaceae bacterium]